VARRVRFLWVVERRRSVFGVTGGSAWRGGLVLYIRWCLGEREMVGGCIE